MAKNSLLYVLLGLAFIVIPKNVHSSSDGDDDDDGGFGGGFGGLGGLGELGDIGDIGEAIESFLEAIGLGVLLESGGLGANGDVGDFIAGIIGLLELGDEPDPAEEEEAAADIVVPNAGFGLSDKGDCPCNFDLENILDSCAGATECTLTTTLGVSTLACSSATLSEETFGLSASECTRSGSNSGSSSINSEEPTEFADCTALLENGLAGLESEEACGSAGQVVTPAPSTPAPVDPNAPPAAEPPAVNPAFANNKRDCDCNFALDEIESNSDICGQPGSSCMVGTIGSETILVCSLGSSMDTFVTNVVAGTCSESTGGSTSSSNGEISKQLECRDTLLAVGAELQCTDLMA